MTTQTLNENQKTHGMVFSFTGEQYGEHQIHTPPDSLSHGLKGRHDEALFLQAIAAHSASLISFAKTLLNTTAETASEFVENLFLDLWNNPEKLSVDLTQGPKLKIYLMSEVRQRAFLSLHNSSNDDSIGHGSPSTLVDNGTILNDYKFRHFMTFSLRSIVYLTLSVGFSFEEIAMIEGEPLANIQQKYLEGIKLLKSARIT